MIRYRRISRLAMKLRNLQIPVFVSLSIFLCGVAQSWKAPWFCHVECPEFEISETHDDYEVRKYSGEKWASTVVEGYQYDKALRTGFEKLFAYISGANQGSVKIAMTAPVRTLVHSSEGPFCKSNFTISFYVPARYQENPPKPADVDVFIEESKPFTAYVGQYSGWNSETKVVKNAAILFETLHKKGIKVVDTEYYTAGYDSPFRLLDRHNEVWLIGREDGG